MILVVIAIISCSKEDAKQTTPVVTPPTAAILTTSIITTIASTTAICGGNISADGGGAITARGVCWNTDQNPTIANTKTTDGTGKGDFVSSITGLTSGLTYYVRAYATNSSGTSYGNQVNFKTLSIPILTTTIETLLTSTTVTSGGNITDDGGYPVTSRGVCWNTLGSPTTSNYKTTNGTGIGTFVSGLTGLTEGTTYHLRAYATNSLGTAYGTEITFTTLLPSSGTVNDIDGNVYHYITIGSQVWMVENLKTTRLSNGAFIPLVTNANTWGNLSTPAYCWYNNDETSNKNTYGALYNWYTVDTNLLAPVGWHIASDGDWSTLITYLGGYSVAGGKMKETGNSHWASPNTGATNSSGFKALPGGLLSLNNTTWMFGSIGAQGYWWSSSYLITRSAISISANNSSVYDVIPGYGTNEKSGMYVRCVRN